MTWVKQRWQRIAAVTCYGLLFIPLHTAGQAAAQDAVLSKEGLYQLAFTAELDPIVINRMHRWILHLADNNGRPVAGATLKVVGGMPEHNHGLPTQPEVTAELGDGNYRLEGMRFHMQGNWEITVSIDARNGKDSALIRLTL